MAEFPTVPAGLVPPDASPWAAEPAAAGARPSDDLAVWQPWRHAIRQERQIAQALAPALTTRLVAAYIERYLLTPETPPRASLESALRAQRPDLMRHLSAWMRRRPSPPLQDALWQGLFQWLAPHLQALAAPPAAATGARTLQDVVEPGTCPLEAVLALLRQEPPDWLDPLCQALDLPQRTHEELQKLLRLRPIRRHPDPPHPESPLFVHQAVTPVATGSPMLSSTQALLRADLWQPLGDNVPTYRRDFSQERRIEHYM